MKLDAGLTGEAGDAGTRGKQIEAAGYDGAISFEINHDPFLPLAIAASQTSTIELGTSIAVAFARNPMLLANIGHDLQRISNGRFFMGLGSQIKPHITKRFSMPWSNPAARMEEMIAAIKAIWDTWNHGTALDFRGDFYQHTLMTPMFDPGPNPQGPPPILLAAVGPLMTATAGRVADGLIAHAFTTPAYFRDVTLPAFEAGLAESGRSRSEVQISLPMFIVSGTTEEEMADNAKAARQQIAFYGSTPAYRGVLEHHGWGEAQTELNLLSKQGKWVEMADLIDDEMFDEFAVRSEPSSLVDKVSQRYGGLVDRTSFSAATPESLSADTDDGWRSVFDGLKAL